jgi:flagellar transcriptional activator FlhD
MLVHDDNARHSLRLINFLGGNVMTNAQLLEEIRDTNLSYLMLAQRMLREDREQAMFRLGLTAEVADVVAKLSPAQILKVAASNMLLARFRFTEDLVWNLLTGHSKDAKIAGMHASLLMAGTEPQAA